MKSTDCRNLLFEGGSQIGGGPIQGAGKWGLVFALAAAISAGAVTVDDTISFTTSPFNEIVRPSPYTFSASPDLDGFDPGGAEKLILAFASENAASVTSITYGGVSMSPAVVANNGIQLTGIYYLDNPPATGGLVVQFGGSNVNGVGGSLIAVSDVETGFAAVNSSTTQTVSLTTTASGSLVVASHANNGGNGSAQADLTALLDGPVGSAGGGTGCQIVESASAVTPNFTGSTSRPVSAAVEFLSGNGSSANTFPLNFTPGATGFDFSWPSQNEKLYDLVSATDLSTSPDNWDVYDDGASTYSDLVATPPDNTLSRVSAVERTPASNASRRWISGDCLDRRLSVVRRSDMEAEACSNTEVIMVQ